MLRSVGANCSLANMNLESNAGSIVYLTVTLGTLPDSLGLSFLRRGRRLLRG